MRVCVSLSFFLCLSLSLKTVPDELRIDIYAMCVAAETNSIINQARHAVNASPAYWPNLIAGIRR